MAWDLFKRAFEFKLLRDDSITTPNPKQNLEANAYIERAESHSCHMKSDVQKCSEHMSEESLARATSRISWENFVTDLSLYSPFLFASPIRLGMTQDMHSRKESATIIFNLALIDHLRNRDSEQAVALYELAMTLLEGELVDFLGIALMNNIGVWCYENDDHDSALTCMNHVASFIVACDSVIDQEELDGLRRNVLWCSLNPQYTASPAA